MRATKWLECLEMIGQYAWVLRHWSVKFPEDQRSICPLLQYLVVVKQSSDSIAEFLARLVMARGTRGVPLAKTVEMISDVWA